MSTLVERAREFVAGVRRAWSALNPPPDLPWIIAAAVALTLLQLVDPQVPSTVRPKLGVESRRSDPCPPGMAPADRSP